MMKKLTIIFLLLNFLLRGQSQEYMCYNWGLVKIGDSIMIDDTEISVGEWLDFVSYSDFSNYPSYVNRRLLTDIEKTNLLSTPFNDSLLPDLKIINNFPFGFLFVKSKSCEVLEFSSLSCNAYLPVDSDSLKDSSCRKRLIAYLNMPIVGISFEQANKFCQWRTTVDSLRFFSPPDTIKAGPLYIQKLIGTAYVYRLPTPKEFDLLNPAHDSIYNKKGIVSRFNYKNSTFSTSDKNKLCGKSPMDVNSFPRSVKSLTRGTKNMQGNVAEMTATKGVAKGGSYYHYARQSYPDAEIIYNEPQCWLGFRCVGLLR